MTPPENPIVRGDGSAHARAMRGRIFLMALVGGAALLGLVFPFPLVGRLWSQIFDLAHAPVFCLLLIACAGLIDPASIGLPPRFVHLREVGAAETVLLAGGCLLLGGIGELLQVFAQRSPGAADLAANGAGVLSGVLWIRSRSASGRGRLLLTLTSLTVLVSAMVRPTMGIWGAVQQRSDFPLLASFERRSDLGVWAEQRSTIQRTREWATDGTHSLRLKMFPGGFTGVNMIWPVQDWRGYDRLNWDIHNTKETPLRLTLKIYDLRHTHGGFDPADRFEMRFLVPPTAVHSLSVDLSAVLAAPETRSTNMAEIAGVELFTARLRETHTVMLDNMRLVKDTVTHSGAAGVELSKSKQSPPRG